MINVSVMEILSISILSENTQGHSKLSLHLFHLWLWELFCLKVVRVYCLCNSSMPNFLLSV